MKIFGVVVWTVSDVVEVAILTIALLLFIAALIVGGILRIGDWMLRRGTKKKEEDDADSD